MNDKQRECAWGRIEFYTKLLLADLIILATLLGWIGIRFEAEQFSPVFYAACVIAGICAIIGVCLPWSIVKRFTNLEAASK